MDELDSRIREYMKPALEEIGKLSARLSFLEQAVDALKNNPTHKAMVEEVFGKQLG